MFLQKIQAASDLPGQKGLHYDEDKVWAQLRDIVPNLGHVRLLRVTKMLEKDANLKQKIKEDYGQALIDDLGILSKLYNALK